MTRMRSAPTIAPKTVPMPPVSAVPPITAAATACSSMPSPIEGSGELRRSTWISPAKPASTEQSMKQIDLDAVDRDAHRGGRLELAAGRLGSSCRNWCVEEQIERRVPSAASQNVDMRKNPTGAVKAQAGASDGSGGKPLGDDDRQRART